MSAASPPLRDGSPLPFQIEESLLVSSSVWSQRVGNSSVVCSRIYLQAVRSRGKGGERNSVILNLTPWSSHTSLHLLWPQGTISTTQAFPRPRLLVQGGHALPIHFDQPSSPLCLKGRGSLWICEGHWAIIAQSVPKAKMWGLHDRASKQSGSVCRTKTQSHEKLGGAFLGKPRMNTSAEWRREGCRVGRHGTRTLAESLCCSLLL